MNAESIAFLIDDSNRFESNLGGFLARLHGNIDTSTYETLEEQVKEIIDIIMPVLKTLAQ